MYEAELYSKNNEATTILTQFILEKYKIFPKLDSSMSILEVGFGDGNLTESVLFKMLPKGAHYVGMDISKEMIEYVRKKETFQNLELHQLDVTTENLPGELKGRFDVVVALTVFHHVKQIKQALKNIFDMLKPSGEIFLTFFEISGVDEPFDELSKNPRWAKYGIGEWCSIFYKHNIDGLKYYDEALTEIGYEDIKGFRDTFLHPMDLEAFKELMISVNRTIKDVAEEEREDYVDEYWNLCLKQKCVQFPYKGNPDKAAFVLPTITISAKKVNK